MKKITVFLFVFSLVSTSIFAQKSKALTAEDYARAEKMLGFNTSQLVDRGGIRPNWLPDGRFWYQVLTPTGKEFVLINPATGERKTATDQKSLGIKLRCLHKDAAKA